MMCDSVVTDTCFVCASKVFQDDILENGDCGEICEVGYYSLLCKDKVCFFGRPRKMPTILAICRFVAIQGSDGKEMRLG